MRIHDGMFYQESLHTIQPTSAEMGASGEAWERLDTTRSVVSSAFGQRKKDFSMIKDSTSVHSHNNCFPIISVPFVS